MTTRSEGWLPIDHPDLPLVRRNARESMHARIWLLDSARRWAHSEFMRRLAEWNPLELQEEIRRLRGHQVAVLTVHLDLSAKRRAGLAPRQWKTHVGLLLEDADLGYVSLDSGRGSNLAGVMEVVDIIELPPEFRIERWSVIDRSENWTPPDWSWPPKASPSDGAGDHGGVRLASGDTFTVTTKITMT